MPERREAVLTLYPIYFPDAFPSRSLTFASDDDYFEVGRSSKREAKNLIPAPNNALFDSRVMSRGHARFGVHMEKKMIFVSDGGSMHGTWVNGTKIHMNRDVPVHAGDILTFGAEVTRGSETFAPLRVRCGCEWFDYSEGPKVNEEVQKEHKSVNCFEVPHVDDDSDEDSDMIEIGEPALDRPVSPVIDNSEVSDNVFSDHDQPIANSTPGTSPSSKGPKDAEFNRADGTSHSPIVVDGGEPLVTPRMTPPATTTSHVTKEPAAMDLSDSESENFDEPLSTHDLDYYLGYSDHELNKADAHSDVGSSNGLNSSDGEESEAESQSDYESEYSDNEDKERQSKHESDAQVAQDGKPSPTVVRFPELNRFEESMLHPVESPWSKMLARSDTSMQSSEKTHLPSFKELLDPLGPRDTNHLPAAYPIAPLARHHPEPSLETEKSIAELIDRQEEAVARSLNRKDIYNADKQWSHESSKQEEIGLAQSTASAQEISQVERDSNTRVAIADIVDTESRGSQGQKRKAANMELDSLPPLDAVVAPYTSDANPASLKTGQDTDGTKEAYFQDAQPRPLLDHLAELSQSTNMHTIDQAQPVARDSVGPKPIATEGVEVKIVEPETVEPNSLDTPKDTLEDARPNKRVKTSDEGRGRGFAGHAATALAGAVVGGLGTIALLASLPPDYFV